MKNTLQEFMTSHIEPWLKSGLSKAAYCRKAEIQYQTFLYYANGKHKQVAESGFTMLEKTADNTNRIELHLPNGCFFSLPENCSLTVLEKLVRIC